MNLSTLIRKEYAFGLNDPDAWGRWHLSLAFRVKLELRHALFYTGLNSEYETRLF